VEGERGKEERERRRGDEGNGRDLPLLQIPGSAPGLNLLNSTSNSYTVEF